MHNLTYLELKDRCEPRMALQVCDGCTACWLRCSDGVQATREEWEAIERLIEEFPASERSAVEQVVAQDKSVDLGDDVHVAMCRFFDMQTRRCAVYDARPLVCRLLGHVEWLPCPIEKVPHVLDTPMALSLIRAYSEQVRRTFAEWESTFDEDSP
jgi:hypothetical protein